jgi:hypothetical protein
MKRKTMTEVVGEKSAEPKSVEKAARAGRSSKGGAKPRNKENAKTKAEKTPREHFDFIGKVESLVVKGGSNAGVFEFGLRGRHGSRQTFRLKTDDSFSLNIIAPVVTAAHAREAKIGVRVATDEGGIQYVTEVASRPKLGKTG